jgi:hypothetical protein
MSMSEKNLAVLLTAKKSAVKKKECVTVTQKQRSDGTREWLAFRTECVVLKKKGV